ncbi:MAG: glycosyltransferase family 2 protein [Desulfuromonadales bacterium]|nr:glycosyltransferase family 2 protein [Desulfuromonadales bacterium]
MKESILTVLMPVYNAGPFLREAIDSILGQTFQNFEFLIINDGSTDDSVEIIKSFDDPRIRLVHNERNLGLIATLNKGLDLVNTRYLARMDADDISLPQRFEKQLQAIQAESNIIACGTAYQKFGAQNHVLSFPESHEEIYCGLLFTPTLAHAAIMFDMEMVNGEGYRFDPDYAHAEDYEFWTRLGLKYRLANLPEVLYRYRMHSSQVSYVHSQAQVDNSLRVQQTMLRRLGFEPSATEMGLHRTFFTREAIRDFEYLTEVGRWFDKILSTNEQGRHFDRTALLGCLGRIWFSRAYRCSRNGMKVFRLYRTKRYAKASLKSRVRFFAKCLLKR